MAYTLQSSGLATDLLYCLMIDEDGQTLKEFVNGWTSTTSDGGATWTDNNSADMTVDDGVLVSSSAWKSRTLDLFETKADGSFGYKGVRFPGEPALPGGSTGSGFTVFIAVAGASAGDGAALLFIAIDAENEGLERGSTDEAQWDVGAEFAGNTALPSDGTTAFSFGSYYQYNGDVPFFYGLESGSLSADGTPTTDGRSQTGLLGIGGGSGQGNQPHKPFIYAYFDRELTLTEMQSLHDDFFGTLFEAGGGTSVGQSTETDAAFAATAAKQLGVGQATETQTAFAATAGKLAAVAQALETDAALGITALKTLGTGLATETDTGQPATAGKAYAAGQALETAVAQAVGAGKTAAVGLATEVDSAFAAAVAGGVLVGQAVESNLAQTADSLKSLLVGLASESDTALSPTAAKAVAVQIATETDESFAVTARKAVAVQIAEEVTQALGITVSKDYLVGLATEVDSGLSVTAIVGALVERVARTGARSATLAASGQNDSAISHPASTATIVSSGNNTVN